MQVIFRVNCLARKKRRVIAMKKIWLNVKELMIFVALIGLVALVAGLSGCAVHHHWGVGVGVDYPVIEEGIQHEGN